MTMFARPDHQYIQRHTGRIVTERLFSDWIIHLLYAHTRENAPRMFNLLTARRANDWSAFWQFDMPARRSPAAVKRLIRQLDICLAECLAPEKLTSPRRLFERRFYHHGSEGRSFDVVDDGFLLFLEAPRRGAELVLVQGLLAHLRDGV